MTNFTSCKSLGLYEQRILQKMWKMMRLTTFLLLISTLSISAKSYSQINLSLKNASIKTVFSEIRQQTGSSFLWTEKTLEDLPPVNVSVQDANLSDALKASLNGLPLTYDLHGDVVYIKRRLTIPSEKQQGTIIPTQPSHQITGTVIDSTTGQPLVGVTIKVKNNSKGTVTDAKGNFNLEVDDEAILEISYLGYSPKVIPVEGKDNFKIKLSATARGLDQVVVIGYGSVKEKNLTGSVTSINVDELPKTGKASISSMLAGKAPGMLTRKSGAEPGAASSFLIRGAASPGLSNAPLIVIDGFPIPESKPSPGATGGYSNGSSDILNSLNPNDIASISILKDASATAIYGARAANGVILITTKKGKKGDPVVNYNFSMSFQKPENPYDFMDAKEWMTEMNRYTTEKWLYNNKIAPYGNTDPGIVSPAKLPFAKNEIQNAHSTNWFDLVTRTGIVQEHNISVRAGGEKSKYMISFNYYNNKGILKNIGMKRYTGRINFDQQFSNWLKFKLNVTGSHINKTGSQLGGRNGGQGILGSAYEFPPNVPVRDSLGNLTIKNPYNPTRPAPVPFLAISDHTANKHYLLNSSLTADIVKGLKAKVTFGFDQIDAKRKMYFPKTFLKGEEMNGSASVEEDKSNSILTEMTLNYNKEFDNNLNFSLLLGYSYQNFENEGFNAANNDFVTDAFLYNNLIAGASDFPTVGSYKNTNAFNSYFTRIMLNYQSKYLLTLTMRADGASNFSENYKYGYFPSAAFAWRIIDEAFMQQQNVFSDLKFRVSFGQTGNSSIGGSAYELYQFGTDVGEAFGNQVNVGAIVSQLGNPDLKWETTTEADIGLDVGFIKNRISLNADFYRKVIFDVLSNRVLPPYQIVSTVPANIGKTQSMGFGIGIHTVNTTGALKWNTDINMSSFRDRWKERDPLVILPPYESKDAPLHAIYGYLTDGIIQAGEKYPAMSGAIPGELKIRDINSVDGKGELAGKPDGKISEADEIYLGSSLPKFSFGFNNTFQYQDFDLKIFLYGSLGVKKYNSTRQTYTDGSYFILGSNAFEEIKDRWAHDNQSGSIPSGIVNNYFGNSDFYLEKAGFLRLQDISLGYNLARIPALSQIFQKARLYVYINNLFVITDYKGSDPETDSFTAYPFPKTFSVGLNLQF